MYIETKTNDFFSLSRRHGLFGGANCKEKERRNKGDFLAPFSTRIQLKKKRTIITTRFFLNAHIKTTKQHLHPIPFLATALYSSKLLFWKIVSTEREEGEEYCFYVLCVSVNYNNQINHRILFLRCSSPAICASAISNQF